MKKLNRKFFQQNTLFVAQNLLGKFLVRKYKNKIISAKIVETEAYCGPDDLASHASRGRTLRTETMYGKGGIAYIYLIYGMHYLLNIVTENKDYPAAVLIRAVAAENIDFNKTNGPGKVGKFFQINKSFNGKDITSLQELWIEDKGLKIKKAEIKKSPRIGVSYAKHCAKYLRRFYL